MVVRLLVITLLFCSSHAFSLEVSTSEITYIGSWPTYIDIKVAATPVDAGCGHTDLYRIELGEQGAQEKYSTVLSAFMAGKPVGFSINGCVGNRAKIQAVRLYK